MPNTISFLEMNEKELFDIYKLINKANGLLIVKDISTFTDISALMEKLSIEQTKIKSIHLYKREEKLHDETTFFTLDIYLKQGTIRIESFWSALRRSTVSFLGKNVLKPIYENGYGNNIIIENENVTSAKHALKTIMQVAKDHRPYQFKYETPLSHDFLDTLSKEIQV